MKRKTKTPKRVGFCGIPSNRICAKYHAHAVVSEPTKTPTGSKSGAWVEGRKRCSAKKGRFCDLRGVIGNERGDCDYDCCPIQRAITDEGYAMFNESRASRRSRRSSDGLDPSASPRPRGGNQAVLSRSTLPRMPEVKKMSAPLLSCPFCGYERVQEIGPESPHRDIHCGGCGATTTWSASPKEKVPELWNRRAPAAQEAGEEKP